MFLPSRQPGLRLRVRLPGPREPRGGPALPRHEEDGQRLQEHRGVQPVRAIFFSGLVSKISDQPKSLHRFI